jgi:hypothetical protein
MFPIFNRYTVYATVHILSIIHPHYVADPPQIYCICDISPIFADLSLTIYSRSVICIMLPIIHIYVRIYDPSSIFHRYSCRIQYRAIPHLYCRDRGRIPQRFVAGRPIEGQGRPVQRKDEKKKQEKGKKYRER